jgi:hypothetical protein
MSAARAKATHAALLLLLLLLVAAPTGCVADSTTLAESTDAPVSRLDPVDIAPLSTAEVDARIARYDAWARRASAAAPRQSAPLLFVRRGSRDRPDDHSVHAIAAQDIAARAAALNISARHVLAVSTLCGESVLSGQRQQREALPALFADEKFCVVAKRLVRRAAHVARRLRRSDAPVTASDLVGSVGGGAGSADDSDDGDGVPDEQDARAIAAGASHFAATSSAALLSLFLVHARWGGGRTGTGRAASINGSVASTAGAAAFFEPLIDLLPRVPPSPVCTFTAADIAALPIGTTVLNERAAVEAQWRFVVATLDASRSRHSRRADSANASALVAAIAAVFPSGELTLPRFLWAHCAVRARMLSCFATSEACVVPIAEFAALYSTASYRVAASATESPAVPSSLVAARASSAPVVTASGRDRFVTLQLSAAVRAGRELAFDRALVVPFLARAGVDVSNELHCAVLPLTSVGTEGAEADGSVGECVAAVLDSALFAPPAWMQVSRDTQVASEQPLRRLCIGDLPRLLRLVGLLRLFDDECTLADVERRRRELQQRSRDAVSGRRRRQQPGSGPAPALSAATRLRAVAFVGKLVRAQLDRLSRTMSELAPLVAGSGAGRPGPSTWSTIGGGSSGSAGELADAAAEDALDVATGRHVRGVAVSAAQRSSSALSPAFVPRFVVDEAITEASSCASESGLACRVIVDSALGVSGTLPDVTSECGDSANIVDGDCSDAAAAGGAPTRVAAGMRAVPRHASLIHAWSAAEHATLLEAHTALAALRSELRAALEDDAEDDEEEAHAGSS